MQRDNIQKKMSLTHKKQKIFNVRKVQYKHYDHDKYNKPINLSPVINHHQHLHGNDSYSNKTTKKVNEYGNNNQLSIISSFTYKQLAKKYKIIKEQHNKIRLKQIQDMKSQQEQLNKCKVEKERLDKQRLRLIDKRNQLKLQIQQIREKNQMLRSQQQQRNEQYRLMNMDYLRNMIIGMRYQNGMEIDLDNMSYEELLQLQEKIGNVSKGLTKQEIGKLTRKIYHQHQGEKDELCPICYYNVKNDEQMLILPCQHSYHSECIQEWLLKEKICPMCKQEIVLFMKNEGQEESN